jgi:aspartate/methionine/tyrosine aminotransferase
MIEVAGGKPVPVPLCEEDDFSFDLQAFDRLVSERTRMVILNSPSNPTGGVMPMHALEHIAAAAQRLDFWVLSDEIYTRLVYGAPPPSIVTLPGMAERTIICDGFSKTYAMTGWRLGYGIMPPALAERVELLLTHSIGCTAGFTQIAGLKAVRGTQRPVDAVVEEYRKRRDILVEGLNAIPGVSCRTPQGAFYAFPNIAGTGLSSMQFADQLLDAEAVAVTPGDAFGPGGEGYVRLSYANSDEMLAEGARRIKRFVDGLHD